MNTEVRRGILESIGQQTRGEMAKMNSWRGRVNKLYPALFQHLCPTTWAESTFTPSTSKASPTTRPHPFDLHVIQWPHFHLLHAIKRIHQFMSFINPYKPSSTLISHLSSNLILSIVVDYNTIDMIYIMICALWQDMCSTRNGTCKSCLKFPYFQM